MARIVVVTTLSSFVLVGCEILALGAIHAIPGVIGTVIEHDPNDYEGEPPEHPYVFHSTSDAIVVWYGDGQNQEAMQLISEHCDGSYVAQRRFYTGSFMLEADCT